MDRSGIARRVVAAGRWARGLHPFRVLVEQRVHLAALLTILVCASAQAADPDITFARGIAQSEFRTFSHLIAQGIYATPVGPARASGLLGFDVGVAATVVKVDTSAPYWRNSVGNNTNAFVTNGYVGVPRIVFSKGFGSGTISGSYAKITDSGIKTYGGALDLPIIRGTLATPEIALRATYAQISGVDVYRLKTYGVEGFISKGFGPLTPYAGIGRMRSDARGTIPASAGFPELRLMDKSDFNRYTAGLRISLLVPKITIEATQAEVRSYAAKISFGF